jgi:hypothetical protein
MKSLTGHIATLKSSQESGLVLGEININNSGWKVQFSFDNKILIERTLPSDLDIKELVNDESMLKRLTRDINSNHLETRQYSSELLCYFIEETGTELDMNSLSYTINVMVDRIAVEENWDVGQKLGEGIYEFICLQKIEKNFELDLIKKLATLDKDFLYSYLNDEEYLKIKEVSDFINDKNKWWNNGS